MKESMKSHIKNMLYDKIEQYKMNRAKAYEVDKYKDEKRKAIYETVTLTEAQKRAIDDLYSKHYGEKIPYVWHQHFTAFTGKFDVNYFPESLFIPEFEHYMNSNREYARAFEDKNILPMIAGAMGVKMPKTVLANCFGIFKDANGNMCNIEQAVSLISDAGELFVKPTVDSCSGQGCQVLYLQNGIDQNSGLSCEELLHKLGDNFVMQERLKCHSTIANIYSNSVNTFRIMTYRWKNEIKHAPIIMRIGQGGACVDNAHAGGMFIALDDDGTMHKTAFTEFKDEYDEHPNTGLRYDGYNIPLLPEVIKTAIKMHTAIPQLGIVNWDFTINEEADPVLIEANIIGGSIWLFEMAHGCGVFREDTPEMLRWLKFMKTCPREEREKYSFGKMNE